MRNIFTDLHDTKSEHHAGCIIEPYPKNKSEARKCAIWEPLEQKIFMSTAEHVTAEGHHRGKCFSSTWWERLRELFNKNAGKDWTISQLKNHWGAMHTNNRLLFKLLQCTGIACSLSTGRRINAQEWWWKQKIKENPQYGKFKDNDNMKSTINIAVCLEVVVTP
ncbi:Hypothetical predicted protein [Olea europaea subsp. europaea]|uniref:Myb/SANT-like domain-containing protein n=1 Tax=Olea europaea subsp. europaea TaxID=158383 RepID=A0A8S0PBZ1_OLEEU|nr:Hypothetical predicted protein [Olea europaea subsp. europaea]